MAEQNLLEADRWDREKRILNAKLSGLSVNAIAKQEGCQPETVSNALKMIYTRYVDMQIADGAHALAECVLQTDHIVSLASSVFLNANRTVAVTNDQDGARVNVTQPDWNSRVLALRIMLDTVRLKSTIFGFTRADVSPIIQLFNAKGGQVGIIQSQDIDREDVPTIRTKLREVRALIHGESVKKADIRTLHQIAGVRDAPADKDLPGVFGKQDDKGSTK